MPVTQLVASTLLVADEVPVVATEPEPFAGGGGASGGGGAAATLEEPSPEPVSAEPVSETSAEMTDTSSPEEGSV